MNAPGHCVTQVRRNAHVEIVPLSTGCLGACTYCKTKHARGQLGSYLPEAIVARVAAAAADPLVSESGWWWWWCLGGGLLVLLPLFLSQSWLSFCH